MVLGWECRLRRVDGHSGFARGGRGSIISTVGPLATPSFQLSCQVALAADINERQFFSSV
jgi:hypothetical protein